MGHSDFVNVGEAHCKAHRDLLLVLDDGIYFMTDIALRLFHFHQNVIRKSKLFIWVHIRQSSTYLCDSFYHIYEYNANSVISFSNGQAIAEEINERSDSRAKAAACTADQTAISPEQIRYEQPGTDFIWKHR